MRADNAVHPDKDYQEIKQVRKSEAANSRDHVQIRVSYQRESSKPSSR